MIRSFDQVEDVIENEDFQAWFAGKQVDGWEEWLMANPAQAELVEEAVEFMKNIRVNEMPVPPELIANAHARLKQRLERDAQTTRVIPIKRNAFKRWIGAAAAILIIATGIYFYKYTSREPSVSTAYGQIASHELPDGSVMMLNANSSAKLGKDWKDCDREVWLNGEAFFHVKKTPQKNRFVVHTNDLDVIVTGTKFNVWTRDNKTSVLLTEGSVTIHTLAGEEIKMQPGDFVQIDNKTLEKKKANEESILAWKDNRIPFDNTPIREAAKMITEHYGIKVTVDDSLPHTMTLSGMMPNNNLDILLRSIEATNEYRITRKDAEILISKP